MNVRTGRSSCARPASRRTCFAPIATTWRSESCRPFYSGRARCRRPAYRSALSAVVREAAVAAQARVVVDSSKSPTVGRILDATPGRRSARAPRRAQPGGVGLLALTRESPVRNAHACRALGLLERRDRAALGPPAIAVLARALRGLRRSAARRRSQPSPGSSESARRRRRSPRTGRWRSSRRTRSRAIRCASRRARS